MGPLDQEACGPDHLPTAFGATRFLHPPALPLLSDLFSGMSSSPMSSAAEAAAGSSVSATAASPATAAAAMPTPSAPQSSVGKPIALTCIQALGQPPLVDSSAALSQLAHQLHVLTAPLPTAHSSASLTALEDTVLAHLGQIDQFSGVLETIKHDTGFLDQELMRVVTEKQAGLDTLFRQVHTFDKYAQELERYVSYVERRTSEVEDILKRTHQMEIDFTRQRDAKGGMGDAMVKDLKQAEQAMTRMWSSLKSLGSKPTSAASAATSSPTDPGATPTTLDIVDAWVPFETAVDIDEYFNGSAAASKTVDPADASAASASE